MTPYPFHQNNAIHSFISLRLADRLSATDKSLIPEVSVIRRFHCSDCLLLLAIRISEGLLYREMIPVTYNHLL